MELLEKSEISMLIKRVYTNIIASLSGLYPLFFIESFSYGISNFPFMIENIFYKNIVNLK
jgi:hypothetical protein